LKAEVVAEKCIALKQSNWTWACCEG